MHPRQEQETAVVDDPLQPSLPLAADAGTYVDSLHGEVVVRRGEPVTLKSPIAAMRLGIATIYQELDLVDDLSVAENAFLGHERMIVSDVPGTTRDSVDTMLKWHRRQFRIVDTAGIRRPGRVARSGQVESVSVLLARRAAAAWETSPEGADLLASADELRRASTHAPVAFWGEDPDALLPEDQSTIRPAR